MGPLELTFDLLDDAFYSLVNGDRLANDAASLRAHRIGPIVELYSQSRRHRHIEEVLTALSDTPSLAALRAALAVPSSAPPCTDLSPLPVEFHHPLAAGTTLAGNPGWTAFRKRFERGAAAAGFDVRTAKGLTGALGELVNNATDHSGAAVTTLVAYRSEPGTFEFAVADAGIGVLTSLRKCSRFALLDDAGEALEAAIRPGVSGLLDHQPYRGYGFQSIFNALADLNGTVRLRSDDHVLWLRGVSLEEQEHELVQSCPIPGFFASAVCLPRQHGFG